MDIVSLVETFLKSIFEAKELFFEKPEDLASFEQLISDASNKMAADFIGMSLTELDFKVYFAVFCRIPFH